jgi:hypothetical protein
VNNNRGTGNFFLITPGNPFLADKSSCGGQGPDTQSDSHSALRVPGLHLWNIRYPSLVDIQSIKAPRIPYKTVGCGRTPGRLKIGIFLALLQIGELNEEARIMRNRKSQKLMAIILISLALPILSNCSMIGYHVGKAIDNGRKNSYYDIDGIKEGSHRSFYLKDGTIAKGAFRGLDTMTTSEYSRYDSIFRDPGNGPKLPEIGEAITVRLKDGNLKTLEFEYFGYEAQAGLPNRADFYRKFYVYGKMRGGEQQQRFYFPTIDKISPFNRNEIDSSDLLIYTLNGELPLKSQIVLRNRQGDLLIPLNQVKMIRPAKRNAKWVGLGIGILLDAAVITTVIATYIAMLQFSRWAG